MTQNKFPDAAAAWDPLREQAQPTLIDIRTTERMRKANRFPVPETLLHIPGDFTLAIDCLMRAAYNQSDCDSASQAPDLNAPCNSQDSSENIDFVSSSDGDSQNSDEAVSADKEVSLSRFSNFPPGNAYSWRPKKTYRSEEL